MPGHKPRTSRVLLLISVLLCLAFGFAVTQSSATPSPIEEGKMPDMFVAGDMDDSSNTSKDSVEEETEKEEEEDQPESDKPTEEEPSAKEPTPVPEEKEDDTAQEETAQNSTYEVSPEASQGVWTSENGIWYFLIDGTPYRGWLYDADGHTYYFNNKDGSMKTGWLTWGGKKYYFDADGIMQTGDITVDGKNYHLLEDGSLEGFTQKVSPTPTPETSPAAEPSNTDKDSSDSTRKTIALTFDDGPGSFTNRLLDCLEKNNAKATFFLVGKEIESFPDEVKRMEALGCEIGNHSYDHTDFTTLSAEDISSQISKTDSLIKDLAGHEATVLRPPYGSINDTVRSSAGKPIIIWSVDTLDWKTRDAQQTIDNVLSSAQDGAIILMHDIYSATVDAVETIVPKLIEEGYDLVTVHELAEAHGVTLENGTAYGSLDNF